MIRYLWKYFCRTSESFQYVKKILISKSEDVFFFFLKSKVIFRQIGVPYSVRMSGNYSSFSNTEAVREVVETRVLQAVTVMVEPSHCIHEKLRKLGTRIQRRLSWIQFVAQSSSFARRQLVFHFRFLSTLLYSWKMFYLVFKIGI